MNRIKQMEKAYGVAIGATILLGPTLANAIAATIVTDLYVQERVLARHRNSGRSHRLRHMRCRRL